MANFIKASILGLILILSNSCGTLTTPEYRGAGEYRPSASASSYMREPSSVGSVAGKTSIVDEMHLQWPVNSPRITQYFKTGSKRVRHQGIDLGGAKNTPIMAAHDGKVIYTGHDFRGYGKLVIIENPNGYASFYAHLNSITTREGKWVIAGEKIGAMGRTGRATGVHLHFELRIAEVAVDPYSYLPRDRTAEHRTSH